MQYSDVLLPSSGLDDYSAGWVWNRLASWDAAESEPWHDILQFGYFTRSWDDDGALQVAAAPAAQIQKQSFGFVHRFAWERVLDKRWEYLLSRSLKLSVTYV